MGKCCKCKEYKWRDEPPLPIAYTDQATGKKYCAFHAPVGKKFSPDTGEKLSRKEFNNLVFSRIDETLSSTEKCAWCNLSYVEFPWKIDFSERYSNSYIPEVSFVGSTFYRDVDFSWLKFSDIAYFIEVTFKGTADFTGVKAGSNALRMMNLRESSIRKMVFHSIDAPAIAFISCVDIPEHINVPSYIDATIGREQLYRAMKQKSATEHDQIQASHWHYHEKLMALKRGGDSPFEHAALWLYHAFSGFGERATKAFCWLLALLFLPLFAFALVKLAQTGISLQPDWKAVAEVFRDWQQALPLTKIPAEQNPSVWKLWVSYLSQLLILLQFTLFALALRNRFRR